MLLFTFSFSHQAELCATSLVEIVQVVVGGADGCLFSYGHARLGEWSGQLVPRHCFTCAGHE